VMLSADAGQEEIDKARQLGALSFITKPFTGDSLVAGLQNYLQLGQKAA